MTQAVSPAKVSADASCFPLPKNSKPPRDGPKRNRSVSISIISCHHRRLPKLKTRNRMKKLQLQTPQSCNEYNDSTSTCSSPTPPNRNIIKQFFSQSADTPTRASESQLRNAIPMEPKSTQPHLFSLADFIYKEIFGIYDIKAIDGVHQERVQNFLTIPFHLESVWQSSDSLIPSFNYLILWIADDIWDISRNGQLSVHFHIPSNAFVLWIRLYFRFKFSYSAILSNTFV